jgi:PAS domain S-box-containing protein
MSAPVDQAARETRVLLLPPTRRDGEITSDLLTSAGMTCVVCRGVAPLCDELARGAGAVLLTEEAITFDGIHEFLTRLHEQPSWSDLPVVMLMRGGVTSPAAAQMLSSLRNVTLLERPAPIRSVVSAVQTAVRSRLRQYEIRDQLEAIQRAESRSREAQVRFEAMANFIPQLAWIADPSGHAIWYNKRWLQYTGKTLEKMLVDGWESVVDPGELPRVKAKLQAALASGESWEDTFPIRRHDGQYRWHLSRAIPFRDAVNGVSLRFGTNTDITEERLRAEERQRLLEAERAARREAERISRMKDEFLATLSHELRTPLNAIFGWAQILKMGESDADTVSEAINVIDRNVRLQTQLIEDLLDMSRIVSGKVRLDVRRIDLADVVHASLESVMPALKAKQIHLESTIDPVAGAVNGDPGRLQQVMWNLLTNAIKFTPRGGRIGVIVESAQSHITIRVSDSGEGVSADFLPQLFERFSQADASSKRKHGGLGLGLSIVKNLVEMHGGTVHADSPGKGQGATFVIRLPLHVTLEKNQDTATSEDSPSPADCPAKLTGIKVLVVDDEADARELVRRFLVECEAIPMLAASVAEARLMVREFRPDVILSDIGMPGEDGYGFIRTLRGQGLKTPAIALTAFARSEDRMRSVQAGYQTHLPKPIDPAELIAVIASLAGRFE